MNPLVLSITSLNITVVKTNPLGLQIEAEGEAGTLGWSDFALEHRIYIAPPADGIYEADMVGEPPRGGVPDVVTRFAFDGIWAPFPADLKGLRVCSATNDMVAMLE